MKKKMQNIHLFLRDYQYDNSHNEAEMSGLCYLLHSTKANFGKVSFKKEELGEGSMGEGSSGCKELQVQRLTLSGEKKSGGNL